MDRKTADVIVKIFAVLAFISGLGLALSAIGLMTGSQIGGWNIAGLDPGALSTAAWLSGGMLAILAVLYIALGFGLWTHKNWARVTMVVLAWIGLIGAIITLVGAAAGSGAVLWTGLISLVIAALEIWFFQFQPEVRSLFRADRVSRATAYPAAGKR